MHQMLRIFTTLLIALFSMEILHADQVSLTINGSSGEVNINTCEAISAFATHDIVYEGNWNYEFKLYRDGTQIASETINISYSPGGGLTGWPAHTFANLNPVSGSYVVNLRVYQSPFNNVAYNGSSNAVQVNSSVTPGGSYTAMNVRGRTVSGDFDNDNRVDDLAGFYHDGGNSSSFHVWLNGNGNSLAYQGDNGFWSANTFNSSKAEGTLATGDFDGDGYFDDVAMLYNYGGGNMEIFVFESNGSLFTPKSYFLTSTFDPARTIYKVASGDFDNDGVHDDLAVFYDNGFNSTDIWVFKSNGSAFTVHNYWSGNAFDCTNVTGKVVSGDFDNDGWHDDLATLYDLGNGATESWVFTSNGSLFSTAQFWYGSSFTANKTSARVASGDFDGDGLHDDLAAIYDNGGNTAEYWVFRSNGAYFTPISYLNMGFYDPDRVFGRVVSGDFDHDGLHDDLMNMYDMGNKTVRWHNFKCNGSAFTFTGDWWIVCEEFGKTAQYSSGVEEDLVSLQDQGAKVYPNPFSSTLKLELPAAGASNVQVYDLQGRMIKEVMTVESQAELDMALTPPGTYLVKVVSPSSSKTFRVVKQ